MSVITGVRLYLGELSPNVWHNSTVICLFPFAIMLFSQTIHCVKEGFTFKNSLIVALLVIINALIKPSYLFAYCCLPVAYYLYFGFRKELVIICVLIGIVIAIIGVETAYLFFQESDPYAFKTENTKNGIEIDPFYTWDLFSFNMPLSFFSSLLFPLAFLLFYKKSLKNNFALGFAWITFLAALTIFIFFSESGYRKMHGNFMWTVIPATYLLFAVTLGNLFKKINQAQSSNYIALFFQQSWKVNTLIIFFILHVVSGAGYIFKLLYFKSFV